MQTATDVWLKALEDTKYNYEYECEPRNQKIKEILNYNYETPLEFPIVTHMGRNLNYAFMYGEAAWILSGRNDADFIMQYMKSYHRFSDDGFTLNGAYGPKLIEQVSWAANELANDNDSRRCYINIWRERPGPSKDIPCTTGIQFIIRDGKLNALVNMRSQDVVWGMPYDIFTFSAIAKYMQVFLWQIKNVAVGLGKLAVRVGSLHLYEHHFEDAGVWLGDKSTNNRDKSYSVACATTSPDKFIYNLISAANKQRRPVNDNN